MPYFGAQPFGEIAEGEVRVSIPLDDCDASKVEARVEEQVRLLREYLGHLGEQASRFNKELHSEVLERLQERAERLRKIERLEAELQYPLRTGP